MYRPFLSAISVSAILLGGCGGSDPEPEQLAGTAVTATSAAAVQDAHAGHAIAGADSASAGATHDMSGMEHGSSATATGDHGDHAAAPVASAGTDHSGHASGSPQAPVTSAGSHAGHGGSSAHGGAHSAGHAVAPASSGQIATADHGGHQPSSPRPGQPSTDHAPHPLHHAEAPPAPRSQAGQAAATDQHSGHVLASPGRQMEGVDAGTDKLLTLVAALVQDSVVQRHIEQDSVLRELWRDPGVRRIVLPRRD